MQRCEILVRTKGDSIAQSRKEPPITEKNYANPRNQCSGKQTTNCSNFSASSFYLYLYLFVLISSFYRRTSLYCLSYHTCQQLEDVPVERLKKRWSFSVQHAIKKFVPSEDSETKQTRSPSFGNNKLFIISVTSTL